MPQDFDYDVAVIAGSYAGMAAALQVARARRRRVLVIDAGLRRNRFASHAHGFLTHDGSPPAEIFEKARQQLLDYSNVTWREGKAEHARKADPDGFILELDGDATVSARRLVLAFGVTDTLPDVPGLEERWGKSVFHCPYCHGYELEARPIGVKLRIWGSEDRILSGAPSQPFVAEILSFATGSLSPKLSLKFLRPNHHGSGSKRPMNPPLWPCSGSSAAMTEASAPSSTVCAPGITPPFKSVAV